MKLYSPVILIIVVLAVSDAFAQQTIFNVPTTDIMGRGKVYGELDASFKTSNDVVLVRFSSFVPRVVIGVGGNVEVGLNLLGNIQPGVDSTIVVPTVKWKFYENKKKDKAAVVGANFYLPLRNRSYKAGTYFYLAISRAIGKTRLTAGGYIATRNVFAAGAARGGGQFGVEQTINSRFAVAADWITGRHSSGYFTPGVIYKPHQKVTTYWSYSIGNVSESKGNHFFLFEVGYNFN